MTRGGKRCIPHSTRPWHPAGQRATEQVWTALAGPDAEEQLTIVARVTVAVLVGARPRFATKGQQAFDLLCGETLTWLRREIEQHLFEKAH